MKREMVAIPALTYDRQRQLFYYEWHYHHHDQAAIPSTPPPLMPRPPVEYIRETQDEDARLSLLNGQMPILDGGPLLKANGSASTY